MEVGIVRAPNPTDHSIVFSGRPATSISTASFQPHMPSIGTEPEAKSISRGTHEEALMHRHLPSWSWLANTLVGNFSGGPKLY